MASGSLVNTGLFGQSKAFNFSLTFTQDTWQQFWRCMTVGCIMSDYLMNTSKSGIATTWNELSMVVASLMEQGKIEQCQNEAPDSR